MSTPHIPISRRRTTLERRRAGLIGALIILTALAAGISFAIAFGALLTWLASV